MSRFKNWKKPEFDEEGWAFTTGQNIFDMKKFGWRCQYSNNLKIGNGVDVGAFSYLNAKHGIILGDDVQIGGGCFLYSESTIDKKKGEITIENGACIGANSVIFPHVVVGENSIVGAGSVVTYGTIIPDFEIWVGNPAKRKGAILNGKRYYPE